MCIWFRQVEVYVLRRAGFEPLGLAWSPCAARVRCAMVRSAAVLCGAASTAGHRLFWGTRTRVLPSPQLWGWQALEVPLGEERWRQERAAPWPRVASGRVWTYPGPLENALLKLPLPLLSLPPQDPGFASQALINKKLNDYRKVRYGPRGCGA